MHEATFRPSLSKIITLWVNMALAAMLLVLIIKGGELGGLPTLAAVGLCVLVETLVFSGVFYFLPYFKIEVKDGWLNGPDGWGRRWRRTRLPISGLDLRNIDSRFGWWGIHLIRSTRGGSISVWFLDEDKFNRLLGLLVKSSPS